MRPDINVLHSDELRHLRDLPHRHQQMNALALVEEQRVPLCLASGESQESLHRLLHLQRHHSGGSRGSSPARPRSRLPCSPQALGAPAPLTWARSNGFLPLAMALRAPGHRSRHVRPLRLRARRFPVQRPQGSASGAGRGGAVRSVLSSRLLSCARQQLRARGGASGAGARRALRPCFPLLRTAAAADPGCGGPVLSVQAALAGRVTG